MPSEFANIVFINLPAPSKGSLFFVRPRFMSQTKKNGPAERPTIFGRLMVGDANMSNHRWAILS